MMKRLFLQFLLCGVVVAASAMDLDKSVFAILNLDYPGLEKVREAHRQGDDQKAAAELLNYYRNRSNVVLPGFNPKKVTLPAEQKKWADESLEHKFFAHKGYQPSYFYGKDIDWTYWPVKDNELRWQLHRHKWFTPLGKAYRLSGDEKYAEAWVEQLTDWVRKNPCPGLTKAEASAGAKDENARFSWRPLEVSERLNSSPEQFLLFLPSKQMTPEFLSFYLLNFNRHCEYLNNNYSEQGNHLLFEAQRILQAGAFFPELKDASVWRRRGIDILNREIGVQVYSDGVQFELDPHYHLASINIFFSALMMADVNGYRQEFPQSYIDTIERMIIFTYNITFPDYTDPIFSDNRLIDKSVMIRNFRTWSPVFPKNEQIRYFATERKKGKAPANTSEAFKKGGFFVLRNGWTPSSTVMVVKAGPPGEWHNQPDNGTFELYVDGRHFFIDSGSYIYGGDEQVMAERNWFRQTRVHNTLTLDNRNIEVGDSKCLLWKNEPSQDLLVVENPSYSGLNHRRSIFFVDKHYFVIVDEAIGTASGRVGIHYHMGEEGVSLDAMRNLAVTKYNDGNNLMVQSFGMQPMTMQAEEGWVSYSYRKKNKRTSFAFNSDKKDASTTRFVTVIYPIEEARQAPRIEASCQVKGEKGLTVNVTIDGQERQFFYELP